MTQAQFMYDLMVYLEGVPDEEKYVLMNDYNQYFENRIQNGDSEETITNSLKPPREIARRYKKGNPIPIEGIESVIPCEQSDNKDFFSILGFILLIPVCIVYEIAAAVFCAALLIAVLALCMSGAVGVIISFVSAALGKGFVLLGLGCVFLTLAFLILFMLTITFAIKAVKYFPNVMKRVLANKRKEI